MLNKIDDFLNLRGFNFLADAAYDSHDIYTIYIWKQILPLLSLLEVLLKELSNLYLLASTFLVHNMDRDDLLASPKTLMYETVTC